MLRRGKRGVQKGGIKEGCHEVGSGRDDHPVRLLTRARVMDELPRAGYP